MNRRLLAAAVLAAAASTGTGAQQAQPSSDQTLNLAAYVELLRSDIRTVKVAIITEVMGFSEAEDKAFWPLYRQYDVEVAKLADERLALIKEYAAAYAALTDDKAAVLATKAIDLESRRSAAKARIYEQVKSALSARQALRFLHVEHQLQLLIDLQVASSLPVAPPVDKAKGSLR